jgi:hypothetical protein
MDGTHLVARSGVEVMRDGLAMRWLRRMVREMREALASIIRWVLA